MKLSKIIPNPIKKFNYFSSGINCISRLLLKAELPIQLNKFVFNKDKFLISKPLGVIL